MLNLRRLSCAILVVAGFAISTATSRAVDFRLLPPNTEIVFTINVKQILDSDLVKSQKEGLNQMKAAFENLPNSEEALKYLKQMGFDPFKDLTSISVALPGSLDPMETFVIVEMVVDAKKFSKTAKDAADNNGELRISKVGNVEVYEISVPGGQKVFAALLGGKSLVLTAQEDGIKDAIKRTVGNQITATKVRELLKATNDKQSLNFAITGNAMAKVGEQAQKAKGGAPLPVGNLADVEGITGAITVTKKIDFQLGVGTKDEKSARDLVTKGTAGLFFVNAMVAGQAQQNPDLAPLVDVVRTLRITAVGSNAVLTGDVSTENLEKIIKSLKNLQGGF